MSKKTIAWFLLILLSLIWGSSFILMKRGMDAFTSDEVAALRISIAFLFLLPFHIKYSKIDLKKYFVGLVFMGVFGNLIPAFLFTKAETQISSSLTGMLNALTPLFTIIIGMFWLRQKPGQLQIVGIIVGFIAAICLLLFDSGGNTFQNFSYGFLVLLATICYAISLNGIKKYLGGLNSITATVWAFSITGPIALIYLFGFTSFTQHMGQSSLAWQSLGYISILAIVGSAISVILYNVLIKNAGTVFASSCTYLIPVVAILWGVFDGETVKIGQILSMAVIILSVYLINRD
ncbi:MAG: DMT family transporter [Bacteroidia bacterium]|nr:DMT family transporter [Bacteroidia bacterium]